MLVASMNILVISRAFFKIGFVSLNKLLYLAVVTKIVFIF